MTLQLPAHLQGRQGRNIAATSSAVIGAALPPHISIGGSTFTLVDAAGNEYNAGPVLEVVVADSSGQPPPKRYYSKKWTADSNEPPTCWSSDGITPSRSIATPQARTCAECALNARGSKTSELSGVAIKACRDEIWLAILLPQYPTMLFQLVITPGSFKNWGLFTNYFKGGVDISDVITRMSFQPGINGVLAFEISGFAQNNPQYISNDILNALENAWAEKKTDILIGHSSENLLPAPAQSPQIEHQPQPFTPMATPQAQPAFQQPAPQPQPAGRRRRNTADAAPSVSPASSGQGQPQAAPFMPQQPAPQPNGPMLGFGMANAPAPNAEISATLEGLFGKR